MSFKDLLAEIEAEAPSAEAKTKSEPKKVDKAEEDVVDPTITVPSPPTVDEKPTSITTKTKAKSTTKATAPSVLTFSAGEVLGDDDEDVKRMAEEVAAETPKSGGASTYLERIAELSKAVPVLPEVTWDKSLTSSTNFKDPLDAWDLEFRPLNQETMADLRLKAVETPLVKYDALTSFQNTEDAAGWLATPEGKAKLATLAEGPVFRPIPGEDLPALNLANAYDSLAKQAKIVDQAVARAALYRAIQAQGNSPADSVKRVNQIIRLSKDPNYVLDVEEFDLEAAGYEGDGADAADTIRKLVRKARGESLVTTP